MPKTVFMCKSLGKKHWGRNRFQFCINDDIFVGSENLSLFGVLISRHKEGMILKFEVVGFF